MPKQKNTDSQVQFKSEDSKHKAALQAIANIQERFGEGAIMTLSKQTVQKVEAVSTGCFSLDLALGVGGVPRGRVVEIFGPEAGGKTTLALHVVAQIQKNGGIAAFVDAEHALDPDYARKIGVNVDELLISQPDNGEQALEIVETLVRSNGVDIIVVDSVAALTPKAEIEGEMGDSHMGLQARLMSQALRKLTAIISKTKTVVIFINQTRMKIGIMFGNPETTTGGMALKFYASVRIDICRMAQLKSGEAIVGNRVKAKIVKNKVAPPFRTAEFDIMYGEGISWSADLIDAGLNYGALEKSGNTIIFGETKLGVGREQAKTFLRTNPKLVSELKKAIIEKAKQKEAEQKKD